MSDLPAPEHGVNCEASRSSVQSSYRNDRHAARDVMFRALVRGMADMKPINLLEADDRVVRSSD